MLQVIKDVPHTACLAVGVLNGPAAEARAVEGDGELRRHCDAFDAVVVGDEASLEPLNNMLPAASEGGSC